MTTECHEQLYATLTKLGPRLTEACLGAADEHVLVTWLMGSVPDRIQERLIVLDAVLAELSRRLLPAEQFFAAHSDVLGQSPCIYVLTLPAGEAQCAIDHLMVAIDQTATVSVAA